MRERPLMTRSQTTQHVHMFASPRAYRVTVFAKEVPFVAWSVRLMHIVVGNCLEEA